MTANIYSNTAKRIKEEWAQGNGKPVVPALISYVKEDGDKTIEFTGFGQPVYAFKGLQVENNNKILGYIANKSNGNSTPAVKIDAKNSKFVRAGKYIYTTVSVYQSTGNGKKSLEGTIKSN